MGTFGKIFSVWGVWALYQCITAPLEYKPKIIEPEITLEDIAKMSFEEKSSTFEKLSSSIVDLSIGMLDEIKEIQKERNDLFAEVKSLTEENEYLRTEVDRLLVEKKKKK